MAYHLLDWILKLSTVCVSKLDSLIEIAKIKRASLAVFEMAIPFSQYKDCY